MAAKRSNGIDCIPEGFQFPLSLSKPEFRKALIDWLAYKAERGERYKPRGFAALVSRFESWGARASAEAIQHSMANNYAGVFQPSANGKPRSTLGEDVIPNMATPSQQEQERAERARWAQEKAAEQARRAQ